MARRLLQRNEYTVGWICALADEFTAAQELLDEEHQDHPSNVNDANIYTLGCIGEHNVVLACLPAGQIGTNSAAAVGIQMKATFPAIRFGLMVGIGGGVPCEEADIRLGDIVVSQPGNGHGGVVQYDFGISTPSGFERTGFLNTPPSILLAAVTKLRSNQDRGRSNLSLHLSKLSGIAKFRRDKAGSDMLFEAEYNHVRGNSCVSCAATRKMQREERSNDSPIVHYGTIASGNQVMRDGKVRDEVSLEFRGVLCFEMEAAGLMNSFPCLVIRGICDYADSHKNKRWQPYAAGTAAAYAKELLLVIPPADVAKTRTAEEAMQTTSRGAIYSIPFLKNRSFIGRKAELDVLKQKLMVDQTCQKMSIVGLGGTGKTQVALQFAYMVRETWPEFSIFWMPALSMESFEQACGDIVRALRIPKVADKEDVKELIKQHLSVAYARKWLLVVDNADNQDIVIGNGQSKGIVDYLPQSEEGVILFTTRAQEVAVSLTRNNVLKLGPMERQDALNFLEMSLAKEVFRNNATTSELLEELAYLPLAVVQAAAYLNINEMSIARYLQLLRSTEHALVDLMSREFRDDTRYEGSTNAVATTWVVSFYQIRTRDTVAADLLLFMSCIEWKAIPRSILPNVQSEVLMEDAIGRLCGYSFLTRRGDGDWYDMHRLVHLATRIWVKQYGKTRELAEKGIRHLVNVLPSDFYIGRVVWRGYLPHALRLLEDRQDCNVKERSELCLLIGQYLWEDGRMTEAVRWLKESCQQRETLDRSNSDRLLSQHLLAMAYRANGQVKEAIKLLEHVVAIRTEVLAEDHIDQLASQQVLAGTYQANGQVNEAIKLLERVVAIYAKAFAEDHPHRLVSQHELARAYQANGRVKEAIKLLEHVVAIQAEVLPEDHPYRLPSQNALARAYHNNGQIREAIELLEHVVAIRTEVLAEDHPNRLVSQHELARVYLTDGQVKEAVQLLEHVVAIQTEAVAEDHPNRLVSQHELAAAYLANGQVKEAVQLLEHVVAIRTEVLAEDHPNRLVSQHELAAAYLANGQVKEAVQLLEHVVAIWARVLGEDHPHRLASQYELARVYKANGQVKEAVKLLEHVVMIEAEVFAEDHPSRLISERLLATFYKDMPQGLETRQSLASHIKDHASTIKDGQEFDQPSDAPQAIYSNNNAFVAMSNQPSVHQQPKLGGTSKRRLLMKRLKGIVRKDK